MRAFSPAGVEHLLPSEKVKSVGEEGDEWVGGGVGGVGVGDRSFASVSDLRFVLREVGWGSQKRRH